MRSLRNFLALAQVIFLLTIFITVNAVAQADEKQSPAFTLEVKNNLIDLYAENADAKEILREVERLTGIKVKVLEGMEDRKVTLNIKGLPIYAVANVLGDMGLKNFAGVYDSELAVWTVYMVAEGNSLPEPIKVKVITNRADIKVKKTQIKGREVLTAEKGKNKVPVQYVKDELMLKFHHGVTQKEIDEVLKKYDLTASASDETLFKIGYIKVRIPDNKDVVSVIRELRQEPKLKLPEPNFIANALTISDPLYFSQWYAPGTNFDKAWDKVKSASIIKVAVIDSGVYAGHPDLKGKVLDGYDFVNNDADASDDNGHGTFAGGIIAAGANDIGIKGLYAYARIIPVKVIDENGLGTYEDVAKGIIFAADAGARVINLSIGGYGYSYALQDAVDYALEKGCVVVAAGGNDGIEQEIYPAAYPDVIGVSALGNDGRILPESNRGRHIAVSAPGLDIISTGIDGDYGYISGTSASAPIVSALAAMLLSERSELKSSTIRRLIMQSAKDLGEKGRDKVYGSGEIDALAALEQKVEPFHDVAVRGVSIGPSVFEKGKPTYITANIENAGTYKSEKFDIVLYEVIGDKKQQIDRKDALNITDTTKVIFEWTPEELKENFKFEVLVLLEEDENNFNNSDTTKALKLEIRDGLYVLQDVSVPVHQWIAYQATKIWAMSEIISHLDNYPESVWNKGSDPYLDPNGYGSTSGINGASEGILIGAGEEDTDLTADDTCLSPFWNNPYCYHFWEPDSPQNGAYDDGIYTYGSAYNRAEKLYSKAKTLYSANNKDEAYYWLGRIAHIITDMTVPAHVHNDPHLGDPATGDDAYEDFMKKSGYWTNGQQNYQHFSGINYQNQQYNYEGVYFPSGVKSNPTNLFKLFWYTAQKTQYFASDDYDGNNYFAKEDGTTYYFPGDSSSTYAYLWTSEGGDSVIVKDRNLIEDNYGWTYGWADLDWGPNLAKIAEANISHAMKAVAGLYRLFWNDTHSSPNLTPYTPTGWSDKIVVSTTSGATTDSSTIHTTDNLYASFAIANNSSSNISTPFYTALYVDGVEKQTWQINSLNASVIAGTPSGFNIGTLSAGTHTIKIVTDSTGAVTESNETDNEYSKTITVVQSNCTNTSTLSSVTGVVHDPALPLGGQYYWFDFQQVTTPSGEFMFKVIDFGLVANPADFSACQTSIFSFNNYILHIPDMIFNGGYYQFDLQYIPTTDGLIWFKQVSMTNN